MIKRKMLCTILASAMVFSTLLSGCAKTIKPVANAPKAELKPVNLTMYWVGGGDPKDVDAANDNISKYLQTKIKANLKVIGFDWGSYDTKVGTMIAAGEPADLVFTTGWALAFRPNAQKGAFLPLDELLNKYGQNVKKVLGESYLKGGQVDGVQYGIPVNKDSAHNQGMMFDKRMVDKYKFDTKSVKTLEDLEPMLKVIKDKEKGNVVTNLSVGVSFGGNGPSSLLDFDTLSGDGDVIIGLMSNNDPSNIKIADVYDTQEFKDQLKTVRKYYLDGYIRKDAPTLQNDNSDPFVNITQLKPGNDAEASTPEIPVIQQDITKPVQSNSDLNNSMYAISKTSNNPERAMMLLDLLYTDKTLVNKMILGVEGKNYTKIDENTYSIIGKGYEGIGGWQTGNQFLDLLKKGESPTKWETLKAFNKAALPLNSVGFAFDSSSVTTEMAALVNASKEYAPVILTGAVDPDTYLAKYKEKRKAAGEDKVIAEMQKQYDAFLAAKK